MNNTKLQQYFYIIILLAVVILAIMIFLPYLTALVLATVFAFIFRPLFRLLKRLLDVGEGAASLATVFLVFIVIVVPFVWFGLRMFNEAGDFYTDIITSTRDSDFSDRAVLFIESRFNVDLPESVNEYFKLDQYARPVLNWLFTKAGIIFSSIAGLMINIVIGFFAFFYLLKDGARLRIRLMEISPLPEDIDRKIFDRMRTAINSIIRGALVISVVQGVIAGIGFSIFGVPHPALFGGATAIAALVPGIGTALVIMPAVLFLLISGSGAAAIGLAIWGATAVGLVDNFLGPKLIGHGARLNTLFILISVLGGIQLFGPIGFVVGPLVLSLLFALLDIYPLIAKETAK